MPSNSEQAVNASAVTHLVLTCDESGAKGYADRDEETIGETGVFAGILTPGEILETAQQVFDATAERYTPDDGKLHITDLEPEDQKALRDEIFALIREYRLPCFYEAIHVAGFHRVHETMAEATENARAARRSRIRLSGNRPRTSSLHSALFQGLYAKVLAFCMEREKYRISLEVRTDRVDSPIVRSFEREAAALLDYGAQIERVTGYDPVTGNVVEGEIRTGNVNPEDQLPIVVEELAIKTVDDSDGLIVAADILANSLNYHFRSRPEEQKFRDLNHPEAFLGHPLSDCIDAFLDWGAFDLSDTLYPHPLNPDR